jgi:hypothetical protein
MKSVYKLGKQKILLIIENLSKIIGIHHLEGCLQQFEPLEILQIFPHTR